MLTESTYRRNPDIGARLDRGVRKPAGNAKQRARSIRALCFEDKSERALWMYPATTSPHPSIRIDAAASPARTRADSQRDKSQQRK
jgi:hypothetical protein